MRRICTLFLLLGITACGPVIETEYSYIMPKSHEGRVCTNQCGVSQNFCAQNCASSQMHCESHERLRAQLEYQDYARDRERAGKLVKKRAHDFNRNYSCSDDQCVAQCGDMYRNCFASCGGQVQARQVCTALCE